MIIANAKGAFNAPSENGTEGSELFTLKTATRQGLPVHKVTTRDRDFYFALFESALEFDNDPSYKASRGVYFVEFVCDADECATVLRVARGGNA